jgi:hypothetical protein
VILEIAKLVQFESSLKLASLSEQAVFHLMCRKLLGSTMPQEVLPQEMGVHFSVECRDALVIAMQVAYKNASMPYDESLGYDLQLFRFMLYKLGTHRLRLLCDDVLGLSIHSAQPAFRLAVGSYQLACYACGYSGSDDIWTSFPNNEQGAPELSDINQLTFFNDSPDDVQGDHRAAIVLAHFGHPETGLEAVYLAVPAAKENNRISRWSHVELLWRRDTGEAAFPATDTLRPVHVDVPDLEFIDPMEKPSEKASG